MTDTGRLPIDPAFARALDAFDVPAQNAAFLDRIAAMPADGAPALPPMPRRRLLGQGRRGAWVRRAGIGVIALGIASATAAATGVFPAIRLALPAPIVAMLTHAPKAEKTGASRHQHTPPVAAVAPAPEPTATPGTFTPLFGGTGPEAQLGRIIRRERAVDVIQARLQERGVNVPRPVIRRRMEMGQIAVGAAVRGDTTTPLPPGIAAMRDRAATYLEAHPNLRDRLRARAAAQDAARNERLAGDGPAKVGATPNAPAGNAAAASPSREPVPGAEPDPAALNWTERRLRAFRRQQMIQRFWAAQQAAAAARQSAQQPAPSGQQVTVEAKTPPASEGNSQAPR